MRIEKHAGGSLRNVSLSGVFLIDVCPALQANTVHHNWGALWTIWTGNGAHA